MTTITNQKISTILSEIADILEMKDKNKFKVRAYQRAAREVSSYPDKLANIKSVDKLKEIPGIGESIAEKIKEIGETGTSEFYEQLKKSIPVNITELNQIEGIGPKTIKRLYEQLSITNIQELEAAAEEHKIRKLEGFGEKTEKNILKSIRSSKKNQGRFRLDIAYTHADQIVRYLRKDENVKKIEIAGSLRRKKETIGDADILVVSSNPEKTMKYFTKFAKTERVINEGKTKSTIELENTFQVDLRIIEEKSWGAAIQYFTGNTAHNVKLRKIAKKKGYKLNEYGLFDKQENLVKGKTEEGIYEELGLKTPPPEIRTDNGEIEAAKSNSLPDLVKLDDIKGDLQMHTKISDGLNSIEEMAQKAEELGYKYIAITEHNTKGLEVAGGVDEDEISDYIKKVKQVKSTVKVLAGLEVNIAKDGSLTVSDEKLEMLDFIIVSIHSSFRMSKENMTERIIKALKNPKVHAFVHPTGRLLFRREGYDCDFEKICKSAKEENVALELNAYPDRLDLNGEHAKVAKEIGCKFTIGTDSHSVSQLENMRYGVFMARRGWLEKSDVINTLSYKELTSWLS